MRDEANLLEIRDADAFRGRKKTLHYKLDDRLPVRVLEPRENPFACQPQHSTASQFHVEY